MLSSEAQQIFPEMTLDCGCFKFYNKNSKTYDFVEKIPPLADAFRIDHYKGVRSSKYGKHHVYVYIGHNTTTIYKFYIVVKQSIVLNVELYELNCEINIKNILPSQCSFDYVYALFENNYLYSVHIRGLHLGQMLNNNVIYLTNINLHSKDKQHYDEQYDCGANYNEINIDNNQNDTNKTNVSNDHHTDTDDSDNQTDTDHSDDNTDEVECTYTFYYDVCGIDTKGNWFVVYRVRVYDFYNEEHYFSKFNILYKDETEKPLDFDKIKLVRGRYFLYDNNDVYKVIIKNHSFGFKKIEVVYGEKIIDVSPTVADTFATLTENSKLYINNIEFVLLPFKETLVNFVNVKEMNNFENYHSGNIYLETKDCKIVKVNINDKTMAVMDFDHRFNRMMSRYKKTKRVNH